MTSFALKLIAMSTMLVDHIGDAYFKTTTFMNLIGRIAFPIFAFQISEGFVHTKNLKKYFLRLFLFAVISQIPFNLFHSTYTQGFALNIFFTLFCGLLAIFCFDKIYFKSSFELLKTKWLNNLLKFILAIFPVFLIGLLAEFCKFDYGFFGILIIFLFYIFKNNKVLMAISFALACIAKYSYSILMYGYNYMYVLLCLFTILPIVFICLYNGKQGIKIKYALYAFYPVHLLILGILF